MGVGGEITEHKRRVALYVTRRLIFLIHTAHRLLLREIIVRRRLESNPESYASSLSWREKHAKTARPGNKSTLASIKLI